MEMLRLFGVVRSVFQHSGWVTARCVEKTQGQFWPLIQEKMACEGEDVMRRNCLPAVHKFRLTANADTSERHKRPPLHTAICAQGQVFGQSRDTINACTRLCTVCKITMSPAGTSGSRLRGSDHSDHDGHSDHELVLLMDAAVQQAPRTSQSPTSL